MQLLRANLEKKILRGRRYSLGGEKKGRKGYRKKSPRLSMTENRAIIFLRRLKVEFQIYAFRQRVVGEIFDPNITRGLMWIYGNESARKIDRRASACPEIKRNARFETPRSRVDPSPSCTVFNKHYGNANVLNRVERHFNFFVEEQGRRKVPFVFDFCG